MNRISLTELNGKSISLNANHIVYWQKSETGTSVVMSNNTLFTVQEPESLISEIIDYRVSKNNQLV